MSTVPASISPRVCPATDWEDSSIAVVGDIRWDDIDERLREDRRFRRNMHADQALMVLPNSSHFRAVIWCGKGIDHGKRLRLGEVIKRLHGPGGCQTINCEIWDPAKFEEKMRALIGLEDDDGASPTIMAQPLPVPSIQPALSPFLADLFAKGLLKPKPATLAETPSKSSLAQKFYEATLASAERFLEILHYYGYSSMDRQAAMQTLNNARLVLKEKDPALVERVAALKPDLRRRGNRPSGAGLAQAAVPLAAPPAAQSRVPLHERIANIQAQFARLERDMSAVSLRITAELASLKKEVLE